MFFFFFFFVFLFFIFFFFFFFFSSRRRHTRFDCDWSSGRVLFRSLHVRYLGSEKMFARLAARPMSPLAFSLPVMNIIIGFAAPATSWRKSGPPMLIESFGLPWAEGDRKSVV